MDNLIAARKAKPMIVVMDNLNAVKPGESAALFAGRGLVPAPGAAPAGGTPGAQEAGRGAAPGGRGGGFNLSTFTDMMFTDLIPAIERTYRVLPGRENRAMAGLSMGGMQTFTTALNNLDRFSYLGGFSGSCGGRGGTFDPKTTCGGAFADAAAFNKKVKVLFLGIGSVEGPGTKTFSEALTTAGIHNVYFESPGHGARMADVAAMFERFRPAAFQVGTSRYPRVRDRKTPTVPHRRFLRRFMMHGSRQSCALSVLVAILTGVSAAQPVPVTIDATRTGQPITKLMFGGFMEPATTQVWAEMLSDRKFFNEINSKPAAAPAGGFGRRGPQRRWMPCRRRRVRGDGQQERLRGRVEPAHPAGGGNAARHQPVGDRAARRQGLHGARRDGGQPRRQGGRQLGLGAQSGRSPDDQHPHADRPIRQVATEVLGKRRH